MSDAVMFAVILGLLGVYFAVSVVGAVVYLWRKRRDVHK
jgi:hypothetical protein